jgi:hypothetical protein
MNVLRKIWIGLLSGTALISSCTTGRHPCVYGPPPVDTLNSVEMSSKEQRRSELRQRLEAVQNILREREGAKVYGSPEIIQKYKKETQRLRNEADSLSRELEMIEK